MLPLHAVDAAWGHKTDLAPGSLPNGSDESPTMRRNVLPRRYWERSG